jgi:hypothetical protein
LVALVGCTFVVSLFCLGCVESLPLPKGIETFLFQVILLFAIVSAFDHSLSFFVRLFSFFSFSLMVTKCVCVVNALTKGEIEDLCGSRIDGWLLPGVMSY